MRLPRDLSGDDLTDLLRRHYGYRSLRQRGSHITLSVEVSGSEHRLTVPRHRQIRVGTLNSILSAVAEHLGLSREEVRGELFGR